MHAPNHNRIIYITVILSLLLHSIILILFLKKQNNTIDEKQEKIIKTNKKNIEWAETRARKSKFGAPVIFRNESEIPITNSTQSTQQKDSLKKTELDEKESIKKEKIENIEKINIENIIETIQKESTDSKSIAQKNTIIEKTKQNKSTQIKKTIIKDNNLAQPFQALLAKKIQQNHNITTHPQQEQSPLSLSQLTNGFLEQVKHNGKHTVTMLGKKGERPTDEQLKHERYIQKLTWCLQNSFRIKQNKMPEIGLIEIKTKVLLELYENGKIKQLRIIKSSGNQSLDSFTIDVFTYASSSFPPVPYFLELNPYKIIYNIDISKQLQYRYSQATRKQI